MVRLEIDMSCALEGTHKPHCLHSWPSRSEVTSSFLSPGRTLSQEEHPTQGILAFSAFPGF